MGTYAISGGAGFLGASLAYRLGHAGHRVQVLDSLSGAESAHRAAALEALPMVSVIEGDVRDPEACRALAAGMDTVLHFAAPPDSVGDASCADVIVGGTLALLEAARSLGTVRRFVLASTGAVYGDGPSLSRHEASLPEPCTPRACAALSAEHFCQAVFRREGLQTVCLRFFEVYGPGMSLGSARTGSPLGELIAAAMGDGSAYLSGEGDLGKDYLFIDDAVEGAVRATAAMRGVGGKIFNIGSGQRISVEQAREGLEKLTGRSLSLQRIPASPGMNWQGRADTAAAAGLLQFTAVTALNDGLARTLHWAESRTFSKQEIYSS